MIETALLIERVRASMSEKRFRHTEGCVRMAERLAERWGADVSAASCAAWLHDITKEMPYDEQLALIKRENITLTGLQSSRKIIHAFSGAIVAKRDFGADDDICGAIRWHTTAKPDMTLLEKIVWLSDLTEDGRDFPGVREIRELAFEDIGAALIRGFDTTLGFLTAQGSEIDVNMVLARNFEIAARK